MILAEGLLCGGSSGSAMSACIEAAQDLNENQRVVVILPDGIRNYMGKFVNDEWMLQRNFKVKEDKQLNPELNSLKINQLPITKDVKTINDNSTILNAINLMKEAKCDQLPVLCEKTCCLVGVITMQQAMTKIVNQKLKFNDQVTKCLTNDYAKVTVDESIGKLSRLLKKAKFVAIVKRDGDLDFVKSIVTNVDILNFLIDRK